MTRVPRAALASLALFVAPPAAAAEAPRLLAVKAGRLLEPATQSVRENVVIVIENGRVREIGTAPPVGAELLDLSGLHVLPGFIDGHTHVLLQGDATARDYDDQVLGESLPYRALRAARALRLALDYGFTTLRDIGNEGAGFADVDLKLAVERGIIPGPRLFVATKALAPTGAYGPAGWSWELRLPKGVELCDGPDECRRAVREQIAQGADWIKVYADRGYYKDAQGRILSLPNFTDDELRAIVDQAHRTRRRVAAHSMTPVGHALALGAGVDSIKHGDVLDEATLSAMVARGTYWCPTLTVTEFVAPARGAQNPIWLDLLAAVKESFKRALSRGVRIVLGTDAGGFPWEQNPAQEFRRYVELGMTPWQALRAGTATAAEMLDRAGELGSLRPGARADLVALRDDPLRDISAVERVAFVLKDGVVVKRP